MVYVDSTLIEDHGKNGSHISQKSKNPCQMKNIFFQVLFQVNELA